MNQFEFISVSSFDLILKMMDYVDGANRGGVLPLNLIFNSCCCLGAVKQYRAFSLSHVFPFSHIKLIDSSSVLVQGMGHINPCSPGLASRYVLVDKNVWTRFSNVRLGVCIKGMSRH